MEIFNDDKIMLSKYHGNISDSLFVDFKMFSFAKARMLTQRYEVVLPIPLKTNVSLYNGQMPCRYPNGLYEQFYLFCRSDIIT